MEKTISIRLNKYPVIPHSLRDDPGINVAGPSTAVSLASLFHHYYLDNHGVRPPNPNPAFFEHISFLMSSSEFRFQGDGLGVSTVAKRNRSAELGQAFCRWFLHEHLNITYFAHIEHLINRQMHRAFNGFTINRASSGDLPDYFCAESVDRVFLAEAKGRYQSISFANKEFNIWRKQFDRVNLLDTEGTPCRIKGHIVATRFATESGSAAIKTTVYAEDPESPGLVPLEGGPSAGLGAAIISSHYGRLAEKLGQFLLASALINGVALPQEIFVPVMIWELLLEPLRGTRFVGGYFSGPEGVPLIQEKDGRIIIQRSDPFRLDNPTGTFFGIEEDIFRHVVAVARGSAKFDRQLAQFERTQSIYSAVSILRDGSVVAPVEFFTPLGSDLL